MVVTSLLFLLWGGADTAWGDMDGCEHVGDGLSGFQADNPNFIVIIYLFITEKGILMLKMQTLEPNVGVFVNKKDREA